MRWIDATTVLVLGAIIIGGVLLAAAFQAGAGCGV